MARSVVVKVRLSEDPAKLINSAATAGYLLTVYQPEGESLHLVFSNSAASNPEANANYFEATTGKDITP